MKNIYIHPLPVRIWHWLNALGFLLLIATGVQIRYLDLFQVLSFRTAVVTHNYIGFALIANYFLWLCFYLFTNKITVYLPEMNAKKYFEDSWRQLKFYGYGIFLGEENPHHPTIHHKFNPLQIMMYQIIMLLCMPILFVSGLLLWDVQQFAGIVNFLGGVRVVANIHVLMFIVFVGFLLMHLYLITLGHSRFAHIKAMITGFEEVHDKPKP
ncbi:MAG: cytochrome b/b6 domain-containing protein [Gammaproteobacteria bacterium]|uniref:cytochrome b/b6 domain-containing protein n=1 Tax=Rhodoferax sp. TaxID=50421 RepID=UPI00185023D9|nr:cytochrome b/b6 domain-containing protein [Rhodoferax sp.]MBU3900634.1 cytochrome b/b6 domain-containing protein [Gammaproteobacteria bacterium]MBA3057734.1 cytochrome B [Rhodoferax sp.]MBU3996703.1 cytochrome b/b6 domain-containing protein [Gammaproteobacteria bacterium]MBU4080990.1 cytochrome b/b6 domain-containing protein [Gammaproteobacteria bacterium]MBU4112048.1 cytochrome b/b6 domain-containing protein [Gammaproteobacteria bacterium]